jgi:hypothetical protein
MAARLEKAIREGQVDLTDAIVAEIDAALQPMSSGLEGLGGTPPVGGDAEPRPARPGYAVG